MVFLIVIVAAIVMVTVIVLYQMMALEDKVKWAQQVITRKDARLQEVSWSCS